MSFYLQHIGGSHLAANVLNCKILQLESLAKLAVLQVVSAIGLFLSAYTQKRNRLEQKLLNDLVFVQSNLRLMQNQLMNKTLDLDPIVLDDIDPTSKWVEETKDPVFEADFDFDAALARDEFEANLEAPSNGDPGLVAASRKGKQPMEATSHAARVTRASIRSTSIVIGGSGIEVADEPEPEASSDSNLDDVYAAADVDPVSNSGDEFDE